MKVPNPSSVYVCVYGHSLRNCASEHIENKNRDFAMAERVAVDFTENWGKLIFLHKTSVLMVRYCLDQPFCNAFCSLHYVY